MSKRTPGLWTTRDGITVRGPDDEPVAIMCRQRDAANIDYRDNARFITAAPAMDALLARAADALNARPYNDDMVLGAEISDFRAKLQQ